VNGCSHIALIEILALCQSIGRLLQAFLAVCY